MTLFLRFVALGLWIGLTLVSGQVVAQFSAPKYSNEFLNLGAGARALGMGNTQVAVAQGVEAGYWNPASLSSLQYQYQGSLMHAQYFAGLANYDYAAFATKIDSTQTLGISLVRFGVDDIPDTRFLVIADQIDYSRIRSFSSADYGLFVSYAKKDAWLPGLDLGGSFKIVYRNAGNFANAWGFGLDAGAKYHVKGLMLGLMARDVTSTFNAWSFNTSELAAAYAQTNNRIPENSIELTLPRWIVGVGYPFRFWSERIGALPVVDLELTFDGQRNTLISSRGVSAEPRLGLELDYQQTFFFRAGLQQWQRVKTIDGARTDLIVQPNMGAGFRFRNFTIDYALTNLANQSDGLYSHIFSIKAGFMGR